MAEKIVEGKQIKKYPPKTNSHQPLRLTPTKSSQADTHQQQTPIFYAEVV